MRQDISAAYYRPGLGGALGSSFSLSLYIDMHPPIGDPGGQRASNCRVACPDRKRLGLFERFPRDKVAANSPPGLTEHGLRPRNAPVIAAADNRQDMALFRCNGDGWNEKDFL